MFLNHFKNFYPGVGRDRLIEVAAHFRIVASLGYLLVNSSAKRNQEYVACAVNANSRFQPVSVWKHAKPC
jgi:hypothetical protein